MSAHAPTKPVQRPTADEPSPPETLDGPAATPETKPATTIHDLIRTTTIGRKTYRFCPADLRPPGTISEADTTNNGAWVWDGVCWHKTEHTMAEAWRLAGKAKTADEADKLLFGGKTAGGGA